MLGQINRYVIATSIVVATLLTCIAHVRAETIEEKHENGQLKLRYSQTDGKKNGVYEEFYESGAPLVVAEYQNDLLQGEYLRYHENGKIAQRSNYRKGKKHGAFVLRDEEGQPQLSMNYSADKPRGKHLLHRDGKRHWEYVWKNGELLKINNTKTHLHSIKDLKKGLEKIYKAKVKLRSAPDEHVAALRRLNAYRFICGLPANVVLDGQQSRLCQVGAELLDAHGELSHTPPKPASFSDARYKEGFLATTNSNLALGNDLAMSIDLYMYDSDTFNIGRIGHRRWCMNPHMQTTGFGRHEKFCTMWSMDERRKSTPERLYVAFPSQGYMPVEFFTTDHAWSVSLNSKAIQSSEASRATVFPLDENLIPGEPLEIAYHGYVGAAPRGIEWGPENVLIFKPTGVDMAPGRRYAVEVTGITDNNGKEIKLHYVVQFVYLSE